MKTHQRFCVPRLFAHAQNFGIRIVCMRTRCHASDTCVTWEGETRLGKIQVLNARKWKSAVQMVGFIHVLTFFTRGNRNWRLMTMLLENLEDSMRYNNHTVLSFPKYIYWFFTNLSGRCHGSGG
jgi:hypothetical protein